MYFHIYILTLFAYYNQPLHLVTWEYMAVISNNYCENPLPRVLVTEDDRSNSEENFWNSKSDNF